jgi:hypothetical protein
MKERHEGSTRREAGIGRPSSAHCRARRRLAFGQPLARHYRSRAAPGARRRSVRRSAHPLRGQPRRPRQGSRARSARNRASRARTRSHEPSSRRSDHPDPHQADLGTEREPGATQAGQRRLTALSKARNRRVIGGPIGRDHAHLDILDAAPLDPPRRPFPKRVAVQQQRDHHRRIVRRPAMPVIAVVPIERRQIELRDGIDHPPRQVALRQPLAQARWQQQLLLTVTHAEVLRHPRILVCTRALRRSSRSPAARSCSP